MEEHQLNTLVAESGKNDKTGKGAIIFYREGGVFAIREKFWSHLCLPGKILVPPLWPREIAPKAQRN